MARDGKLVFDPAARAPGRGAYTCRRLVCFERAESRRAFARVLHRTVAVPGRLKALFEEV
ncbi:MAG: YlxR family protein [Actinomycetota bacterium]|nr:YlxR family protein [Actinomycetota bacterium]